MKLNSTDCTNFGKIYVSPTAESVLNQKLNKVQYSQFEKLLTTQQNNPVDVILSANKDEFLAQIKISKNDYNFDTLYKEGRQETNLLKMIRNACKRADEISADFLKYKIKRSLTKK